MCGAVPIGRDFVRSAEVVDDAGLNAPTATPLSLLKKREIGCVKLAVSLTGLEVIV